MPIGVLGPDVGGAVASRTDGYAARLLGDDKLIFDVQLACRGQQLIYPGLLYGTSLHVVLAVHAVLVQ